MAFDPHEFQELKHAVERIERTQERMEKALTGETKYGELGLVKRVKSLESWRNGINLKVATWSGGATALVLVAKYVIEYLHK